MKSGNSARGGVGKVDGDKGSTVATAVLWR